MKQIAFLAIVPMMFAASVYAQPEEEVSLPPDSLQITEETEIIEAEITETEITEVETTEVETTEVETTETETTETETTETETTEVEILEAEVPETEILEVEIPTEEITPLTIPNTPSTVLQGFFQSLKTGDSFMISQLISSDGLDEIDVMLEILKENLDNATISRLITAGYTATVDEIDDWSPMDYLTSTIELPVMKARYAVYEMQIGDYSNHGNELIIPIVFSTASGLELPYQAVLVKEDNQWKVTNFMGLNSFP